jgi:DNA-binding MurR/RpiR family transcriptional regulator
LQPRADEEVAVATTAKVRQDGQTTALVSMRALLPDLRPSERRIAQLFLSAPGATAELAIAQLADLSETSTTSVIRLCKRLGYKGFKDLRLDVLREVTRESYETAGMAAVPSDIDRSDSLEDVIAKVSLAETLSISDTAKVLDTAALRRAADAISSAARIDIFGVGASSVVGEDLQQKLVRIGRTALRWPDAHSAWTAAATLQPGNVAVALSHSGATVDTLEFIELAAAAGATTIAITNHATSPVARTADIVLTTAARETGFRSGALGSRIAQLMVVDCLFIGVAQTDYDGSMAAIRGTYETIQRLNQRRRESRRN